MHSHGPAGPEAAACRNGVVMVAESGSVGERSRPDDIEAGKARNSLYRADSRTAQLSYSATSDTPAVAGSSVNNPLIEAQFPWSSSSPQLRFDISFREPQMKSS